MFVHAITPILNVSNMQETFAWFGKIGWEKAWDWGDPITFASVRSGRVEIFLCLDGQGGRGKGSYPITQGFTQSGDKGAWMSIWVDDVDSVYQQCIANGIEVTMPPNDMPWNVREMHIRHPDGHVFRIGKGFEEEQEEEDWRTRTGSLPIQ
jgi:uncharacterized glyoxalase superfamily protein PhnB